MTSDRPDQQKAAEEVVRSCPVAEGAEVGRMRMASAVEVEVLRLRLEAAAVGVEEGRPCLE